MASAKRQSAANDNSTKRQTRRAWKRDPARSAALTLLYQLETGGSLLDPLLSQLDEQLAERRDCRFARHLSIGCLRWQKRLDWMAGQFASRPAGELTPWVRLALRIGLYQLFWLERVPNHAAVHSAVELARDFANPGAAGLVNAVLRRALRESDQLNYPNRRENPVAYLAIYHSHPEWLVTRWLKRWGLECTEALLQANNAQPPLCIHLNNLQASEDAIVAHLESAELQLTPAGPLPGYFIVDDGERLFHSASYAAGHFQVQDRNAGLPVALLAPQPGERILDLCSAPGGKAVQMAIAMHDQGLVLAADLSRDRLSRVRENVDRLRLQSIRLAIQEARRPAVIEGAFARLLLDVPCSATGTLGRHPDARWRKKAAQLPMMTTLQGQMLAQAFALLPPEGVLVYSTCSLEEEENDGVVEAFLQRTPTAALEPATHYFPACRWAGRYLQTVPGREPGDGCFAARIRKRRS